MVRTIFNVAEKPSVAREISSILSKGRLQKRNGISKFNPVFEFPFDFNGESVKMIITSVSGHLMTSDFSPEYSSWGSCDPVELFEAPIIKFVPESMENIAKTLKREVRGCQMLILWLDCDREGENIAFEVIQVCNEVNTRLDIMRAHFSAVIPKEIYKAMQTLTRPSQNDSLAVDARIELDLRIGSAYTRFQTLRLQKKFQGLGESVLSYGPCQFPTLGFVVDRYRKVINFTPEPFWKIQCIIKKNGESAEFHWARERLFDKISALIFYEICLEQNEPIAVVIDVSSKPKKKFRPFPLTTVELQKSASRKLKMSSDATMKLAEKIYQAGFISYPRTETDVFPDGTDFKGLIHLQTSDTRWGQYASNLLAGKFRYPKKGKHNDQSHPPIHPTKFTNSLHGKEKELYDFIVRHFLACCSDDALGLETVVTVQIGEEYFTTKGLVVEQLNWLEVYPYEKWSDKSIPRFEIGEKLNPDSLLLVESSTVAPSLLSEADLISLMDSNGIGTDATIATHIETIQKRGYSTKLPDSKFTPTTLGLALITGYDAMDLNVDFSKPQLRAGMESDCVSIAKGVKSKDGVVKSETEKYKKIFLDIVKQVQKLDIALKDQGFGILGTDFQNEEKYFSICGKCLSLMSLRTDSDQNRVLFCEECSASYSLPKVGQITKYSHNCPICGFQVVQVQKKDGKNYYFCPYCRNNPPKDQGEIGSGPFNCFTCRATNCPLATGKSDQPVCLCPICKKSQMMLRKNKSGSSYFLGCKGWPNCKAIVGLPSGLKEASLANINCDICAWKPMQKLHFKFKSNSILPGQPLEYTGCVGGCDLYLASLLEQNNSKTISSLLNQRFNNQPSINQNYNPQPTTNSQRTFTSSSSFNNTPKPNNSSTLNNSYQNLQTGLNNSSSSKNTQSQHDSNNQNAIPLCIHRESAVLRTTKQGPNAGRQFYVCGKIQSEQCEFFQWDDKPNTATPRFSPPPSFHMNQNQTQKCYSCNQPGHFSNNCPKRNKFSSGSKKKAKDSTKFRVAALPTKRKASAFVKNESKRKTSAFVKNESKSNASAFVKSESDGTSKKKNVLYAGLQVIQKELAQWHNKLYCILKLIYSY